MKKLLSRRHGLCSTSVGYDKNFIVFLLASRDTLSEKTSIQQDAMWRLLNPMKGGREEMPGLPIYRPKVLNGPICY